MSVSKDDIKQMAELSKIQLTEDEAEKYAQSISKIVDYMEVLDEVDTTDVEPLIHINLAESRYREDVADEPMLHEDALKNAPDADTDYFRVPKVIE